MWYLMAGMFIVLAFGAFFWGFSAAAQACAPCNCLYSMFSKVPTCRWPALLGILYWAFMIAALASLVTGILLRRRARARGEM